ncbi:ParA family protein [Limibaculum sp. M0105]|uniref:ParA family protein n=1 Tax=Thermohalobaculum xanthum TaxID=2753746 RepID=A0A8J7SG78_9RHOB|nr:ParA family partition ATPase [Thermohalobaculum xanthum]MBK0398885.1 ParA family protein [Thermohalobaculum xanthum]
MGHVILLAQQKGGAGKTTLLTQLAAERAAAGAGVTILDLDPQRSTTGWFRERVSRRGDGGGIELLESAEWRARSDIEKAAKTSDWVFVDAPGSADTLGRIAMRAADLALIPCQPSMADVWASAATLEMARKEKLAHAVVLNRVPPRGRAADEAAARLAKSGAPMVDARLGQRSAYVEAFMRGAGVSEMRRAAKAADEVAALMKAVEALLRNG